MGPSAEIYGADGRKLFLDAVCAVAEESCFANARAAHALVAQLVGSAEAGSLAGCVYSRGVLGRCYITGAGVERDVNRGWLLGKESADAGSPYGELVVAIAYEEGVGGDARDLEEAEQHYKIAELNGISEAKFRLAGIRIQKQTFLLGGHTYTAETLLLRQEVMNILRSAEGHADSQILIADMLWENYQVEPEEENFQGLEEALVLLRLALDQGTASAHARGLVLIADIYEYYKKDFNEAFQYRKQSSDRGCLNSCLKLATMYRSGQGTICDVSEAVRLLKPMVDNLLYTVDDSQVESNLINCYLETLRDIYLEMGDHAEALKCCKAGADVGSDECRFAAGCMYEGLDPRCEICLGIDTDFVHVPLVGDGIEIDFCAAAEYYQLASQQEYKSGTSSLARMYEYGLGVEQSFTEAERLLHNSQEIMMMQNFDWRTFMNMAGQVQSLKMN